VAAGDDYKLKDNNSFFLSVSAPWRALLVLKLTLTVKG